MPIIASAKGGRKFEPVSEGVHLATCIRVISIGEQKNELYKNSNDAVILVWKIPDDPVSSADIDEEIQDDGDLPF